MVSQWKKQSVLKRTLGIGLAVLVLGVGAGVGVVRQFYALEWSEWKALRELRNEGVETEDQLGDFAALYRDECRVSEQPSPNCTCLVLVHGAGDQSLTWKRILLEPHASWVHPVRFWAIDLPGFGRTPVDALVSKGSGGGSESQLLQSLRARHLGRKLGDFMFADPRASQCTSWGVIGNSFGGWVAAWAHLEHPRKIQKLMLVDSTGLDLQISKLLSSGEDSDFNGSIEGLKEFQKKAYFKPRELPESVWRQAAKRMKTGSTSVLRKAQSREDALDTYLPSLRAQNFVFWGKEDRVTPLEEGREFAKRLPGAVLREAPECGHLPQKECPKALISVINDFVFYGKM